MTAPWSKVPALPAALGLCAGILYSTVIDTSFSPTAAWIAVAVSAVAAVASYMVLRHIMIPLGVLAIGAGLVLGVQSRPSPLPDSIADSYGTATATIVKSRPTDMTTRLIVDVDSWTPRGDSVAMSTRFRVVVSVNGTDATLAPGTRLKISGKMHSADSDLDLPYQIDYNRYLYIDGVTGRMQVYDDDYSIAPDTPHGSNPIGTARKAWLGAIADAGFDEPTTTFMLAVIGGESLLLDDDTETQFRNTGLSHILAISGLHVGIVVIILAWLLYPIKVVRGMRPIYFGLIGAFVILYAYVAGGSPSVCRAAVMCCVLMGNRWLEIKTNGYQSLSVTVIILLCINPLWLFLPGFQFSVAAVLAIITFSPVFDIVPRRYGILHSLWVMITLPVIAFAGTMLLSVLHFHSFAANFWIANVLASVLVTVLVGTGFIAALLSLCGLHPGVFADLGNTVYHWLTDIVTTISSQSAQHDIAVFMSPWRMAAIVCILAMAGWLVWHYSHRRALVTAGVATLLIFISPGQTEALPTSELYVPRHFGSTDVIIVHNGHSYLWTDDNHQTEAEAAERVSTLYRDFFRHRGVDEHPTLLRDGFATDGLSRHGNTVTLRGRTIARIDSALPPACRVDIALITSKLDEKRLFRLAPALNADSVILHTSINYSRHNMYMRQLDTCNVAYRSLRQGPVVWRFR